MGSRKGPKRPLWAALPVPKVPFGSSRGCGHRLRGVSHPASSGQWLHTGLQGIRKKRGRRCPGEAPGSAVTGLICLPFPYAQYNPQICVWPTQLLGRGEAGEKGTRSQVTPLCRKCTEEKCRGVWEVGSCTFLSQGLYSPADRRPWSLCFH